MNQIAKILTGILGILAVIACLATIGIVGYSISNSGTAKQTNTEPEEKKASVNTEPAAVPTQTPVSEGESEDGENQVVNLKGHTHDYKESTEKNATCYSAGRLKYTCECGDIYYVDLLSTGHLADDWEIVRKPAAEKEGLREKHCIYCDEIMAQESIPYESEDSDKEEEEAEKEKHIHQYTASTEREASCTLAGLRKYSCSCGNFYTEAIPAMGHIATDWTVVEEPTTSAMGREQRTCRVCNVVLDTRAVDPLSPTPTPTAASTATPTATTGASASPGATASASATPTPTPTATPTPTPTPHVHQFKTYRMKAPTCTEIGFNSLICSCGASDTEQLERDLNNHSFQATVIPATKTTQGYTIYRCTRCNYSYNDNYTPALGN